MHIMRAKLMKLTEYEKPKENISMAEMCKVHLKSVAAVPENPTQTFYAKHCLNTLERCKLVAVFHNEGLDIEDLTRLRRRLYKNNMHVKYWGPAVLREALSNSRLQHLESIVHRSNLYVVCEEPTVKELLKAAKRTGRIHLLGGLVEDRFMSPKQMEEYSLLPSLELARGQLSGLLSSSISKTYSLLQSNQQMLSSNLEQLAKGNTKKDATSERTEG